VVFEAEVPERVSMGCAISATNFASSLTTPQRVTYPALRGGGRMGMKLTLGDTVKPYGKVVAVGKIEGEEYYWFIDKHGSVAMIPAIVVEKEAKE